MAQTKTIPPPPEEEVRPAAPDLERLLLGASLLDRDDCRTVTDKTTPADYADQRHKIIFTMLQELVAQGYAVDRSVLIDGLIVNDRLETAGGLAYVTGLDEGLPKLYSIDSYIRRVREKADLRRILDIANDIRLQAAGSETAPAEIVRGLQDRLYTTFTSPENYSVVSIGQFIESQPPNLLFDPSTVQTKGLKTGFPQIDELTNGFHDAEIFVVGAGTSVGKTAFCLQILRYLAERGIPVLLFSMEMPKLAVFTRLVCQIAEISVPRYRAGGLGPKERTRIVQASEMLRGLPLYIDETAGLKASDMAIRTKRAWEEHGIKLTALDFLQKMQSSLPRAQRNDQIADICETIQITAKKTTPFLVLSQLNRGYKKDRRKPSLEDLRDSGAIEQMANVVILPWRPELENKKDPSLRGKAELIVAKHRDGEIRDIPARYIGWRMRFEELDSDLPDRLGGGSYGDPDVDYAGVQ